MATNVLWDYRSSTFGAILATMISSTNSTRRSLAGSDSLPERLKLVNDVSATRAGWRDCRWGHWKELPRNLFLQGEITPQVNVVTHTSRIWKRHNLYSLNCWTHQLRLPMTQLLRPEESESMRQQRSRDSQAQVFTTNHTSPLHRQWMCGKICQNWEASEKPMFR